MLISLKGEDPFGGLNTLTRGALKKGCCGVKTITGRSPGLGIFRELKAGILCRRSLASPIPSQWRDRAGFSPASLNFPLTLLRKGAGHPDALS